jgi:hypothetical protein
MAENLVFEKVGLLAGDSEISKVVDLVFWMVARKDEMAEMKVELKVVCLVVNWVA